MYPKIETKFSNSRCTGFIVSAYVLQMERRNEEERRKREERVDDVEEEVGGRKVEGVEKMEKVVKEAEKEKKEKSEEDVRKHGLDAVKEA